MINILVLVIGSFWCDFCFLQGIILWFINAWDCSENQNIEG